jgi:hypothetical protein
MGRGRAKAEQKKSQKISSTTDKRWILSASPKSYMAKSILITRTDDDPFAEGNYIRRA